MVDAEFVIASRLDHLFNASSKQYYVKDVLTKQTITVEALQLKRSMYNDVEGFVFTHFDLYCNFLKQFNEFDESLKISSFRVLLQVAEKMLNSLNDVLDEGEEIEQATAFKYRNMLKMTVYLLCQFAHAYENENIKKTTAANIGKGRKKKLYTDESESSEWPDERMKYLVVLKKIFELPIRKLWNPPVVEYEFINFVTNAFFKMLENVEVCKDKPIKTEVFRFLGAVLIENTTGLAYSIKILQMVQDFEHLSNVMAEAVVYFMTECSADTLISEICREATLMDVKNLVQNLTAAHSLAQFLTSVCEKCPEKVSCVVGSLLQFLEMESHVMRNCILSIIGTLLNKLFCDENMSSKDRKTREELLDHLESHVLDVNSFVRSKTIQILKNLMEERALSSGELYQIGKLVSGRLRDKASNVRKNAMSFMALFVDVNQFACQVPLAVLKESYQVELDKLKILKKSKPIVFDDSEDEEQKEVQKKGLVFDDSEDEENDEEGSEKTSSKGDDEGKGNESSDKMEGIVEEESKEDKGETSEEDDYAKQEKVVSYLKNTLNFAEVIHGVVEPVCQMLHSSTQTDVIEAIEFFTAAASNMLKGTECGVKEVMGLVWSQETAVKNAALNSFRKLCLSASESDSSQNAADISKNLMNLLKDAKSDDVVNIQALVQHFCKSRDIPSSLSKVLWANFRNLPPEKMEEKISSLLLLTMVAEVYPEFVLNKVGEIISYGLESEGEKNYFIAKHILKVLMCCNAKDRGKYDSAHASVSEYRFPLDHVLAERLKSLLIHGIKNFDDDQWAPMASEAVRAIFCLMSEAVSLCSEISIKLTEMIHDSLNSESEEEPLTISNALMARFLSFCGSVALHYTTYLKVDYFAQLRREEVQRELRRRKSSAHSGFSTPKSAMKTPKSRRTPKSPKSSKKRQSISKTYKLLPPIDEETTYENIIEKCAEEVQSGQGLTGSLLPIVVGACHCTLRDFNKNVQAAASVALTKFMLISETVCEDNMQLYATITEKSPEAYIRANMLVAMGDLTTSYPNIVEPWTPQIYQRLSDSDASVREAAIITLAHLILHDFVRVKSLISEAAKCIADPQPTVSEVAKYLFTELSKKGNIIYNIIPGIISSLSDPKSAFSEESFQVVLKHILQFIEKEKLVEGLVEKLCYRFTDSSSDIQLHELTFCLSILTLNDKCYSKLIEFKNLLRERMSDPIIMKYITNITANAKKNDAKTAAELETFRKELGI